MNTLIFICSIGYFPISDFDNMLQKPQTPISGNHRRIVIGRNSKTPQMKTDIRRYCERNAHKTTPKILIA